MFKPVSTNTYECPMIIHPQAIYNLTKNTQDYHIAEFVNFIINYEFT